MAKDEKSGVKKSRRERGRDKAKPPTKIIIRHLPPTMTEEEFLKQTDPLPEYDFYYFSAADWSLGFDATCRAYITFKNYDDVFLFRDRFDGYVFVDNKGQEYAAIVEYAPFQGFVKNKSRGSDNKVNTIEQESHYQQFLKKLEEEREAAAKGGESKLEFSLDIKKEEITSTPLLQYLASKKEKRREDAKKRTAEKKRRREEDKDKRKQNQAQTQPVKVLTAETNKTEKIEQKTNQTKEEPKNARARRREERNRLRHETYLLKKKAYEEQKKSGEQPSTSDKDSKKNEGNKKAEQNVKSDKDANVTTKTSSESNKPIEILKKSKQASELTESVRNFIFTAANSLTSTINEDKSTDGDIKNSTSSAESKPESTKSTEELNKIEETLSKIDIHSENQTSEEERKPIKESRNQGERVKLTQKQLDEKREERRIRNKDRPSIAIYQPKARLRLSEESDSNSASKDIVRSQSTSDCEAAKKDEQPRHKKVQRYSERSKYRKNIKDGDADEESSLFKNVNPIE